MKSWPTKKLGEVLEINYGKGLPKDSRVDSGKYFAYGSNGPVYNTNESLVNGEVIVIGRKGTAGALYFVSEPCWPIDTTFFAKPKNDASLKFIYYLLQTKRLPRLAIVTGVPGINRTTLANIKVQLPPLNIQKQIVERLDKIAEAQKLNDNLIQKTDELFQSLLHQELNPTGKDWGVKKLGDKNVVEIIDGDRGKNYPPKNEFQKSGYCLFLNTKNVTQAGFIFNETDFISKERDEKLRKGKLQKNDVVLTTRGTVGNSALYDDLVEFNHIRINSGMVVLRSNIKEIMPKFLWIVLSSKPVLRQFKQILSGTAQPQLPITNLVKIKIPLPPLEAQKQIVAKLSAVQEYKTQLLAQKSKLKELFDSALAKSMRN